jgi:flagellar motor switch protein FliM
MERTVRASVIRRKTRAARGGTDTRAVSPVRALRLALARAADTLLGLPLVVATVEQARVEAGETEAALGGGGLCLLLDGAAGMRAGMRLCPALLGALIEVQTTGRVRPGEVRARAPTRTDAALVAPLVDALLAGFDDGLADGGGDAARRGLHFGDRVEDARALALLLVAPEFDLFRLTVDLGPGLRTGRLDLLVPPLPVAGTPLAAARAGAGADGGGRRPGGDAALSAAAMAAPVPLDAVLARIRLPLVEAMALAPGARLDIPRASLGRVRLLGAGGHLAGEGRLGRRDGWRAVRLSGPEAEGRAEPAPQVAAPAQGAGPGPARAAPGAIPGAAAETGGGTGGAAPPAEAPDEPGPAGSAPGADAARLAAGAAPAGPPREAGGPQGAAARTGAAGGAGAGATEAGAALARVAKADAPRADAAQAPAPLAGSGAGASPGAAPSATAVLAPLSG